RYGEGLTPGYCTKVTASAAGDETGSVPPPGGDSPRDDDDVDGARGTRRVALTVSDFGDMHDCERPVASQMQDNAVDTDSIRGIGLGAHRGEYHAMRREVHRRYRSGTGCEVTGDLLPALGPHGGV